MVVQHRGPPVRRGIVNGMDDDGSVLCGCCNVWVHAAYLDGVDGLRWVTRDGGDPLCPESPDGRHYWRSPWATSSA